MVRSALRTVMSVGSAARKTTGQKCVTGKRSQTPARAEQVTVAIPARSTGPSGSKPGAKRHVHDLSADEDAVMFETISIDQVGQQRMQAFVTLQLDLKRDGRSTALRAKIDTGAQANVLPLRLYRVMFADWLDSQGRPPDNELKGLDVKLLSYGGTKITHYGECQLNCTYNGKTWNVNFFVTAATGPATLGLPSLDDFGIVTIN